VGRMKRSNFGGFRVKFSGTKQTFVTSRFQDLPRFPKKKFHICGFTFAISILEYSIHWLASLYKSFLNIKLKLSNARKICASAYNANSKISCINILVILPFAYHGTFGLILIDKRE
jgi:hypothetical protein